MALRAAASSAADEAELWTLIERAIKEEDSGRYALTATLYGRAEAAATKLHGELSLIPVYLRSRRAKALVLQAQCGAAVDDVEQWRAEAWALEERNVKVVERREAEATLVRLPPVRLLDAQRSAAHLILWNCFDASDRSLAHAALWKSPSIKNGRSSCSACRACPRCRRRFSTLLVPWLVWRALS